MPLHLDTTAKRISFDAVMLAVAMIAGYIENLIPVTMITGIPGVKLGLANSVTVLVILFAGIADAAAVMAVRSIMSALLFGSLTALPYALGGGLLSFFVMTVLIRSALYDKNVSLVGVSVAGAAAHNIAQTGIAALYLHGFSIFAYLPVLLISAVITGFVVGVIIKATKERLLKIL